MLPSATLSPDAGACRDRLRELLAEARRISAQMERLCSPAAPRAAVAQALPAVLAAVAAQWPVSPELLLGRGRWGALVEARFAAWTLLLEATGASQAEVGRAFGRDHGTVFNGLAQARRWAAVDTRFAGRLAAARAARAAPPEKGAL